MTIQEANFIRALLNIPPFNSEYGEEPNLYTGVWKGEPAWSNGHIQVKGEPPPVEFLTYVSQALPNPESMDKADKEGQQPATLTELSKDNALFWRAHFSTGAQINAIYLDVFLARWPDATFLAGTRDESIPVVVMSGDKRVGLIMPMRS